LPTASHNREGVLLSLLDCRAPARSNEPAAAKGESVNALSHVPDLLQVARAILRVDSYGALPDLREEIGDIRRKFRSQQNARTIRQKLSEGALAEALENLLDISDTEAQAAAQSSLGTSWPTIASKAILDFAADLDRQAGVVPSTVSKLPATMAAKKRKELVL